MTLKNRRFPDRPVPIVNLAATLAKFTDEERAKFETLHATFKADPAGNYCDDDDEHPMRKALCRALGLPGYTESIWSVDPTMNPAVVEDFMRMQYNTLNHLPHEQFVQDAALAKLCRDAHPEEFRWFGATLQGSPDGETPVPTRQTLQAEKLVQDEPRIVRPAAPRIAAAPQLVVPS